MSGLRPRSRARTFETWLWTGPVGHLVGGTLDVGEAIARHALAPRLLRSRPRRRGQVRESS